MNFFIYVYVSDYKSPFVFMFKFHGRLTDMFSFLSSVFDSSSINRVEIFDSSQECYIGSIHEGRFDYE